MTVSDLTQKLRLYRDMAARARKAAEDAQSPELRRSMEELARSWEELIKEVETLGRGTNGNGKRR
jgi:Ribonuclease G/E